MVNGEHGFFGRGKLNTSTTNGVSEMKYTAKINGEEIVVMKFKKRKSMENYMANKSHSKVIFIKAGTYVCTA